MEDVVYYNELYYYYGSLLTDVQRKYFEDYYCNNLSFGEMSEIYEVSRNAIFRQIKIVLRKLDYYENKLGLYKKMNKIEEIVKDEDLKKQILDIF